MSILLATGHHEFDKYLMGKLQTNLKVDYLEEIEFEIYSNEIQTIILSEYIPSLSSEEDKNLKHKSLLSTIELLRKNHVRVIFLTSPDAPKWLLGRCITLGVYDLILTDGNVNLDIIMSFFFTPSTAEQAKTLLSSLHQQDSSSIVEQIEETNDSSTIHNSEFNVNDHSKGIMFDQVHSPSFLIDDNNSQTEQIESVNHPWAESSFGNNLVVYRSKTKPILDSEEDEKKEFQTKTEKSSFSSLMPEQENYLPGSFGMKEEKGYSGGSKTEKIHLHPSSRENSFNQKKMEKRILSFWSLASGMGGRTIAQTYAKLLAERGAEVLFVELDYFNPSFAATSGLSHPTKNMLQYVLQSLGQDEIEIESFIARPSEVPSNKKSVRKTIEKINDNLQFLTFPKGFKTETFPVIEDQNFVSNFIKNIKAARYDFIILNLPHQIENMFTFPIMLDSDITFNIMNLHPARILKYMQIREMLQKTPFNFEKMKLIVNIVPEDMKKESIESILNEKCEIIIPYCPHRAMNELDLEIGSPGINDNLSSYLSSLGISEENVPEKKKKFLFGFKE